MYNINIEDVLGGDNTTHSSKEVLSGIVHQEWIDRYIRLTRPDFVCLMDMKLKHPVIYQKKCNRDFIDGDHILDIFNAVDKRHIRKILQADILALEFANKSNLEPEEYLYQLKFCARLDSKEFRTLQRNTIVLSNDKGNKPHMIFFALFDVTKLFGLRNSVQIDIKCSENKDSASIKTLREQLSAIISHKLFITKREKEIIDLIAVGKTSEQIGSELNISKATVNKHRQNLIKKNKVPNISALIKLVDD